MTLNPARAGDASAARECTCECGCRERTPFYPSDLTDEQWAVLEPDLPVMLCGTVTGGRPEVHWRRTMIDAVFYLLDNGIKWRAMPRDFPKWQTVHDLYKRWRDDGVIEDIRDRLRARVRTAAGRDPEPSAVIIDAQSVHESAEGVVPAATSGFDGHKKVNGRKRHVMTDTMGLLTGVAVSAANVPDQSGAVVLLLRARRRGRARIRKAWTDKGYSGDAWQQWSERELGIEIEIVEQDPEKKGQGFQVLPRRWVVERTHAWITRRRRCARDYERLCKSHAAMVNLAGIFQMTRRLARTRDGNTIPG